MGSCMRSSRGLWLGILIGFILVCPSPLLAQSLWDRGKPKPDNNGAVQKASIYTRPVKTRPPLQKHDIVLILVQEQAEATNNARLDSRREMEAQIAIDQFIRFSGHKLKPDFSPQPEIDFEATRELIAQGRTDRRETVRMRIAARIVDVRPNGNLILEAKKQKRINAEETIVTLTGEIRADDVGPEYTVSSDRVADMKFAYSGEGPVSANTAWSWAGWIIDKIWPF